MEDEKIETNQEEVSSSEEEKDSKPVTKSKKKSEKSAPAEVSLGHFLSNAEIVRKNSNYLISAFNVYCKNNQIPYRQTMNDWEKLYKKFINS